jgi:hypothetical protein
MSAPLSKPRCRRRPRRVFKERVWRALQALRPARRRRCEAPPDWLDGGAGAVALEHPLDEGCDG